MYKQLIRYGSLGMLLWFVIWLTNAIVQKRLFFWDWNVSPISVITDTMLIICVIYNTLVFIYTIKDKKKLDKTG